MSASTPQNADVLVAQPPIDTSLLESLLPDRLDHIYLYRELDNNPRVVLNYRYRLTIVDRQLLLLASTSTTPLNHATAVFLIPAGRESEYLFGTRAGLQSVAESAGCARLIAVAFGRRYEFGNSQEERDSLQEELTHVVQLVSQQGRFLPPAHYKRYLKSDTMSTIPFLALDGVGSRNVLAEGATLLSGTYLVEQVVKVENDATTTTTKVVRRLYFMENPFVIQSEVAMMNESNVDVDKTYLAFDYHKTMTAGLLALTAQRNQGVVIGLGGGGLVNFLQATLPSTHITVVELDASVVTVAETYFGFVQNDQMTVRVGDGLSLVSSSEEEEEDSIHDSIVLEPSSLDFIAMDVDSKDSTVGMSCPPQAFVQVPYLTRLKSLLHPDGWLIMNVSARDPTMLELVKTNVQAVFGSIFLSDNDKDSEDVNVVLFATLSNVTLAPPKDRLNSMHKALEEEFVQSSTAPPPLSLSWQSTVSDLEDCVAGIKVLEETVETITNKNKKKSGGKRKKGKRK